MSSDAMFHVGFRATKFSDVGLKFHVDCHNTYHHNSAKHYWSFLNCHAMSHVVYDTVPVGTFSDSSLDFMTYTPEFSI